LDGVIESGMWVVNKAGVTRSLLQAVKHRKLFWDQELIYVATHFVLVLLIVLVGATLFKKA